MEFVMVPVPVELETDTRMFLMGLDMRSIAGRSGGGVDPERLDRMLSALRPESRKALSLICAASAGGQHATVAELAAQTGWSEHHTSGVVTELIAVVAGAFGVMLTMLTGPLPDVDDGSIDWSDRTVVAWVDLVTAVLEADARPVDP